MHAQLAAAVRTGLPIQYHSTPLDDHCITSSYVFLTACSTSQDLVLTYAEFRVGFWSRANTEVTGKCNYNAPAAYTGHDLTCATRVEFLKSAENRRYRDKIVVYHPVFTNF